MATFKEIREDPTHPYYELYRDGPFPTRTGDYEWQCSKEGCEQRCWTWGNGRCIAELENCKAQLVQVSTEEADKIKKMLYG